MAQPTKYTKELAGKICLLISTSNRGLRSICKECKISTTIVLQWLKDKPDFLMLYNLAKEAQADFLAEEIIEIADKELKTEEEFSGDAGSSITIKDNVQRSRLMIDSRKWIAAKLKPKKYGDKLDVEMNSRVITVEIKDE